VLQRDGVATDQMRDETVVILGLERRATYMADGGEPVQSAAEDVHQASVAAKQDPELQALLRRPDVALAMEKIAADPSAINSFADQPEVMDALRRLNSLLSA
jgi:hypothetical protein